MHNSNSHISRADKAPSCLERRKNRTKQLQPIDYLFAKSPPSDLITLEDMSRLVNRSVRTLKEWSKQSDFPDPVKHKGRIVGWSRFHFEDWLLKKSQR